MNKIIRENIKTPYSLHDMNIIDFQVNNDTVILKTQSGMVKTTQSYKQVDGYIEFRDVDWDFCYIYLLGVTGNTGKFNGKKLFLKDFLENARSFGFSVIDETFGYNLTKMNGYIMFNRQHYECIVEIYHNGDMVYWVEE